MTLRNKVRLLLPLAVAQLPRRGQKRSPEAARIQETNRPVLANRALPRLRLWIRRRGPRLLPLHPRPYHRVIRKRKRSNLSRQPCPRPIAARARSIARACVAADRLNPSAMKTFRATANRVRRQLRLHRVARWLKPLWRNRTSRSFQRSRTLPALHLTLSSSNGSKVKRKIAASR